MCHRRTGIENRQGNGWCTLRDDLERREALEAVGHEVLVAPDGKEGVRIYRKHWGGCERQKAKSVLLLPKSWAF